MLLTDHVALTSLTTSVSTRSLMIVASAIQKQVTRDFGPLWGVRGTVGAFAELTDVPSDYYHVIVFNDTDELVGRLEDALGEQLAAELIATFDADQITGIHLNAWTRQPFALVQALDESWPAVASHEVLEVLADPYGNRLLAAAHPLDPSERVRYLLEVCDPCQQVSYTVNGVPMSDFYTPRYFDPVRNDGTRFSFTGEIMYPLQVLPGGYLSYIDADDAGLYQYTGGDEEPRLIANLRTLADTRSALRTIVDTNPATPRLSAASLRFAATAAAAPFAEEAVRVASSRCAVRTARSIFGLGVES